MRKFLVKFTLLALPVLILIVAVNYFGDEASLFHNKCEKEMVKIITQGNNVTNFNNFDVRFFQKELIIQDCIKPDLVIMGSSRTNLINSDFFPDNKLINNSVSGACLQDLIIIYQLYQRSEKLPSKIIVGIDPWIFNENNDQKAWQRYSNYYYEFLGQDKEQKNSVDKYLQLFSLSYFQSSFSKFFRVLNGEAKLVSTTQKYNELNSLLSDGAWVDCKHHREASPDEIERKIKNYVDNGIYAIEFFYTISEKLFAEFQMLIEDMRENNIDVEFFISPYAPYVYNVVEEKYPMVLKTEQIIIDYAEQNNIKYYGSFNPYKLNMDNRFFSDGMHCNELGVQKVLSFRK